MSVYRDYFWHDDTPYTGYRDIESHLRRYHYGLSDKRRRAIYRALWDEICEHKGEVNMGIPLAFHMWSLDQVHRAFKEPKREKKA